MGEGHKGCRILCCVLWLLLISHACTGSRCTNTAHCNVVQIMDLCSFLNVPFALSLVVKLRIKLLPSFIRRTKTRLLWENEASRGAVTTLQVVTRSLVSPPTEHCPRLHHSQKLCFNLPPSGFITGTPSEHAGEGLQRDGEGGGS